MLPFVSLQPMQDARVPLQHLQYAPAPAGGMAGIFGSSFPTSQSVGLQMYPSQHFGVPVFHKPLGPAALMAPSVGLMHPMPVQPTASQSQPYRNPALTQNSELQRAASQPLGEADRKSQERILDSIVSVEVNGEKFSRKDKDGTFMKSSVQSPNPPKPTAAAPARSAAVGTGHDDVITSLEIDAVKELFDRLDINHNGEISLDELQKAMEGESELVLSRSHKLRVLRDDLECGRKRGLDRKDFAELMKELFMLSYKPFFKSAHMEDRLTAIAWKHVLGTDGCAPLLRDEAKHTHCFQALKRQTRQERVETFRALMSKAVDDAAEELADSVDAAGEYEVQQQEGPHAGKFAGMVLGDPVCFDSGMDMLGLPDLSFEEAISREHASAEPFKAWNNDVERVTSPAEQLRMALPDGWGGRINNCDYRGNVMCADFEQHPLAVAAGETKAELVMLRLYTGPMYVKYNGRLRRFLSVMKEHLGANKSVAAVKEAMDKARKELGAAYVTSTVVLVSALQKLRLVNPLPAGRRVYRGFAGLAVPESFMREDDKGNRGGVEFGFLSTSISKAQALGYINFTKGMPQLYEIEVGQIDRGADIAWISYFPGEAEVLMPPLCSLEAVGDPKIEEVQVEGEGGGEWTRKVMVWPIRINVNLKGKTIDEHRAHRKALHGQMADNALAEATALLRGSHTPSATTEEDSDTGPEELRVMRQRLLVQCEAVVERYRQREDTFFNDDAQYSAAIQDVLQLRPWVAGLQTLRTSYGVTEAELRPLDVNDHLPSLSKLDVGRTAMGKAARAVCLQRKLFEGDIDEVDGRMEWPLVRYTKKNDTAALRLLLAAGASTEKEDPNDKSTVLIVACQEKKEEAVRVLLEGGANVHATDEHGNWQALTWAVEKEQHGTVQLLLAHSADPNWESKVMDPPLITALYSKKEDIAATLLQGRADPNVRDTIQKQSALAAACCLKLETSVRLLVEEYGADVDQTDKSEQSPLHMACSAEGMQSTIELLLQHRANVNLKEKGHNSTPLHFACTFSVAVPAVEQLVKRKADVNAVDKAEATPLMVACEDHKEPEAVARILLDASADVNAVDKTDRTALKIATDGGKMELAALLTARGAVSAEAAPVPDNS